MVKKGLLLPAVPENNCLIQLLDGRFFNHSAGLGMQLTTASACDASRRAAGCCDTPLMRFGIVLLTSGITYDAKRWQERS